MYQSVIVATDGSEIATRAVAHGAAIAKAFSARLSIVTVTEQAPTFDPAEIGWSVPTEIYDDIRKANADRSRRILALAASSSQYPAHTIHVEERSPYEGILDAARKTSADLIVVGSYGKTGIQQLVLGSQASKVVSLAQCAVLVVK